MFKRIALGGAALAVAAAIPAVAAQPVPLPAPPDGKPVPMPAIKPRVAAAGSRLDANGVNLAGRPQLKLRMTDAQAQPYWDRYNACLHDHGVPLYPRRGLSPVQEDRDPAAERACHGLLPRMPVALDRDRNPRFAQDLAAEIACMNRHGVPVVADPAGGFWTYGDASNRRERWLTSLAGEQARLRIERSCELQAFGADD
jgi:hypothetical protein